MKGGIGKYLAGHAEPEPGYGELPVTLGESDGVVVIPAYDEPATLTETLERLPAGLLTVLVINAPPGAEGRNAALFQALDVRPADGVFNVRHIAGPVLVVNRSTTPLPPRQGVGLARKIGADIALRLMADHVLPVTWIHSTDADVTLPPDYALAAPAVDDGVAALVYPFEHVAPNGLGDAMARYEVALHHYVLGLALAGSGYAHHTIGSTLAFHPVHYALCRGFPKRAAGEDFYLLNKLAKLGAVRQLASPFITVSGRASARVPVGTGSNVARIDAMDDPEQTYRYYNPQVFTALAEVLARLRQLALPADTTMPYTPFGAPTAEVTHLVERWWRAAGVEDVLDRANVRTPAQRSHLLGEWFDGFRTMRFIHEVRDAGLASVTLAELCGAWGVPATSDPTPLLSRLRRLCFTDWAAGRLPGGTLAPSEPR